MFVPGAVGGGSGMSTGLSKRTLPRVCISRHFRRQSLRDSLGDGLLPRGVFEFGEIKQCEQKVFIQLDRDHLEQNASIFDVKDTMF
jgi:hypothetical protein